MWRVFFIFLAFLLFVFIYLFVVDGEISFSLSFSSIINLKKILDPASLSPFHPGICYSHLAVTTKMPSGKGDEEAEFATKCKILLPIKLRDRQPERK